MATLARVLREHPFGFLLYMAVAGYMAVRLGGMPIGIAHV